jgi:hypothetical protein
MGHGTISPQTFSPHLRAPTVGYARGNVQLIPGLVTCSRMYFTISFVRLGQGKLRTRNKFDFFLVVLMGTKSSWNKPAVDQYFVV